MKNLILTVFLFSNIAIFSQENPIDTILVNKQNLDEVVVTAIRASSNNPVPFKMLDANDISRVNLGQDVPVILSMTPSVNITSDAGNGIGYTGMSIRGSDGSRINVTIMVYHLMIQNPMLLIGLICQILRVVFQVFRFSVG